MFAITVMKGANGGYLVALAFRVRAHQAFCALEIRFRASGESPRVRRVLPPVVVDTAGLTAPPNFNDEIAVIPCNCFSRCCSAALTLLTRPLRPAATIFSPTRHQTVPAVLMTV